MFNRNGYIPLSLFKKHFFTKDLKKIKIQLFSKNSCVSYDKTNISDAAFKNIKLNRTFLNET